MAGTDPTPEPIFELGNAFLASRALMCAVDLGLFGTLHDSGAMTRREIESEFDFAHHHGVRDFLDVLASHDLLDREGETYRNTDLSEEYLVEQKDSYVGDWIQISEKRMYESAKDMTKALRTGGPQNELGEGETLYKEGDVYETDESRDVFQEAMRSLSVWPTTWLAENVDWEEYDTVCDLGAAKGTLDRTLAEATTDLNVVGFDLPDARPGFESYTSESPASDRISFFPGDFFEDSLPDADAYVFGHILNDWDAEEKRDLVGKVYDHLPEGGALYVHETMLDDERQENQFGLYMNMVTLLELQNGYCSTVSEYVDLLESAGFDSVESHSIPGSETVVIGRKS